jgi:hypothetical protein
MNLMSLSTQILTKNQKSILCSILALVGFFVCHSIEAKSFPLGKSSDSSAGYASPGKVIFDAPADPSAVYPGPQESCETADVINIDKNAAPSPDSSEWRKLRQHLEQTAHERFHDLASQSLALQNLTAPISCTIFYAVTADKKLNCVYKAKSSNPFFNAVAMSCVQSSDSILDFPERDTGMSRV